MTSKQRAYLKGLAMKMEPIMQLGKGSVTPENTAAVDEALAARELIKISVLQNCLDDPRPVSYTHLDVYKRQDMMSVDDVTEILAVNLLGTILDDEQIVIAANQGEPLSGQKSQAEEEYRNICRRLLGEEVPFVELQQKKGMLKRLSEIFHK